MHVFLSIGIHYLSNYLELAKRRHVEAMIQRCRNRQAFVSPWKCCDFISSLRLSVCICCLHRTSFMFFVNTHPSLAPIGVPMILNWLCIETQGKSITFRPFATIYWVHRKYRHLFFLSTCYFLHSIHLQGSLFEVKYSMNISLNSPEINSGNCKWDSHFATSFCDVPKIIHIAFSLQL